MFISGFHKSAGRLHPYDVVSRILPVSLCTSVPMRSTVITNPRSIQKAHSVLANVQERRPEHDNREPKGI